MSIVFSNDDKSDDKLLKQTLAEETKLSRYQKQLSDIKEKIRLTEERIGQLKTARITNIFNAAESILQIKGLTFTEVMTAVENGNLLELQEKIESQEKTDGKKEAETDLAAADGKLRPHGEE